MKKVILPIVIVVIFVGLYQHVKPLPEGINIEGTMFSVPASSIHFFRDVSYVDDDGIRHSDQQIFDEIFQMIEEAESYILLDFFLFNDLLGKATSSYRGLSGELTQKLIEKKKANPNIIIQFITDPINEIYGGYLSPQIESLKENGVNVILTDLKPLRDSNPIHSAFWRTFYSWFGNSTKEGIMANPFQFDGKKLSVRTYLSLLNFKANHRKVVLVDRNDSDGVGFSVLITSANPHDGSSAHTNTAIKIDDFLWRDVLVSEQAVAKFSNLLFVEPPSSLTENTRDSDGGIKVQLITEGVIRKKIVETLSILEKGDSFDMAMFYISDRKVISALKKADERGVAIRLLLDPNKDAFGREKGGVPNRQVASELLAHSNGNTQIRWCDTHGEQCHSKLLLFDARESQIMIQGSANLTKRNIGNLNLETNVFIESKETLKAMDEAFQYFNTVWNNEPGKVYSTDYDMYQDDRILKKLQYRFMEGLGTSSF